VAKIRESQFGYFHCYSVRHRSRWMHSRKTLCDAVSRWCVSYHSLRFIGGCLQWPRTKFQFLFKLF